MASDFASPQVTKNTQNVQLSYDLPHRIYTSQVYPIKSPNGSTVILYSHENGVRIVWRGGRAFKAAQANPNASQKTNGSKTDAIISLDSDDEGPSKKPYEDKPEFEDEEEDLDPTRPFPDVLQFLDLHFGTGVIDLAVLPVSALSGDGSALKALEPLRHKIVFAAACADHSLRLVTLPILPPSPESKARPELRAAFSSAHAGNGLWGETIVTLSGHHKPADGVSMTVDVGGSKAPSRAESKRSGSSEPSLIVASHSREVTGTLLYFQIPLDTKLSHIEPFQTVYLPSPAVSISFNTSLSAPRSSHLLVADSTGTCRIFDYRLLSRSSEDPEVAGVEQGSWLLSLYVGFQNNKTNPQAPQGYGNRAGFGRKSILDAKWVSGGRAVIVLLNDGEWAVWDIEGAGPGASQGLLGRQGLKGGSRTEYSLSGYLEVTGKARSSNPSQIVASKFAPMTPSTRKSLEPFGARGPTGPMRGQISVLEAPSTSSVSIGAHDESIVFWLGESYAMIPNLGKYWVANSGKSSNVSSSILSSTNSARIVRIDGVDLQGEFCSGVTQIPKHVPSASFPSDIIVLGEHRFAIVVTESKSKPQFKPSARSALAARNMNGGELDVAGIDQALTRMENNSQSRMLF